MQCIYKLDVSIIIPLTWPLCHHTSMISWTVAQHHHYHHHHLEKLLLMVLLSTSLEMAHLSVRCTELTSAGFRLLLSQQRGPTKAPGGDEHAE